MVYAWDDYTSSREKIAHEHVSLCPIDEMPWQELDYLVLSPGVPLTHPEPHPVVVLAKAHHVTIISDIELLAIQMLDSECIGITGTNGKSTTTSLIGHILQHAGRDVQVGGNLGVPVLNLADQSKAAWVLELSSYQLDLVHKLHCRYAVWMNISPDHLDRHGDMAGYIEAKKRIFHNQSESDAAIISVDDVHSRSVCEALQSLAVQRVVPISTQKQLEGGVAVLGDKVVDTLSDRLEIELPVLPHLQGEHNAQNIAAAYAVCRLKGMFSDIIVEGLKTFKGLPHRMQYLGKKNGITFINDSKATNAEAASKALATFDSIYWIAGGVAKEGGIESLAPYFPHITHAYLMGEAQDVFAKTLEGRVEYSRCQTLEKAYAKACEDASRREEGANVVLSPACASFDQWKNFEARGDAFCELVKDSME